MEEPSEKEMADEPAESGPTETEPVAEETSAEGALDKVSTGSKSEAPKVKQTESKPAAADAADLVTAASSAGDSLVSDVDPATVQDNQNFDFDTKEDSKDGTGEPLGPDSSLLNDEAGGEELDYGDGDDHKEDMISFQIEESEIAIVETGSKETTEESAPTEAKSEEAQGDATKKEDKPSDEKEEEG